MSHLRVKVAMGMAEHCSFQTTLLLVGDCSGHPVLLSLAGLCHFKLGHYVEGEKLLVEFLRLFPYSAAHSFEDRFQLINSHKVLGVIYREFGNGELSKFHEKTAVEYLLMQVQHINNIDEELIRLPALLNMYRAYGLVREQVRATKRLHQLLIEYDKYRF